MDKELARPLEKGEPLYGFGSGSLLAYVGIFHRETRFGSFLTSVRRAEGTVSRVLGFCMAILSRAVGILFFLVHGAHKSRSPRGKKGA